MLSEDVNKDVAPFMGISRHRLGVDGRGVTTLLAFHGCSLSCRHCLNRQCREVDGIRLRLTPEELLEKVKIDHLYFRAKNGGICFGGGEPALYHKFISRFRQIAPKDWHFTIETSLNVTITYTFRDGEGMNNTGNRNWTRFGEKLSEFKLESLSFQKIFVTL